MKSRKERLKELVQGLRDLAPDDMKDQVKDDMTLDELMVLFCVIRRRRWYDRRDALKSDFDEAIIPVG